MHHLNFEVVYSIADTRYSDADMCVKAIRNVSGISEAREIAQRFMKTKMIEKPSQVWSIYEIVNVF